jgi:hypothetical protein
VALLTSELTELRVALGYNALCINAEPYVEYHAIFDRVVVTYLQAGATTTSSTSVAATGGAAAPVAVALASATGFAAGDRVVVDVDARQEEATIQSLSGANMTVQLRLAHSGTYPITVDGGETIVRRLLRRIRAVQDQLSSPTALKSAGSGGLKKVDEIEWHQSGASGYSSTTFGALSRELMRLRDELASALGVQNLFRVRHGGMLSMSSY